MSSVTALPIAPSRLARPATFESEADAWNAALQTFSTEVSAYGAEIATAVDTVTSGLSAALWVSGTTYVVGDKRYSPANGLLYRRIVAGAGTTDPSADSTNWLLMSVQAPNIVTHSGATATLVKNAHNECSYTSGPVTAVFPATPSVGDWLWLGFQNDLASNILSRNGSLIMKQANDLIVGRVWHGGIWRYVSAGFGWRLMIS